MQTLQASDVVELRQHLASFGDDYLFRGQTNAHLSPNGQPSLNSSFIRKGCIPPLMLKWIFFVTELLRRGGVDVEQPDVAHFTQGLLQHYGWRSFFVDLTASPAVAAWFASHTFNSQLAFELCENSFEEPVMLRKQVAHYTDHEGIGHLYVLNKEGLRAAGHELVNLSDGLTTDCVTRFQVQKAWLAGLFLLQRRIDPRAISAEISAPASVFRELAETEGYKATNDVFPPPDVDTILANLLSLPRIQIPIPDAPFPFYLRSLEIPEYQDSFVKHLPPQTVLYAKSWLSDITVNGELWVHVPEDTFYGKPVGDGPIPRLAEIIRANAVTNIETEGLICLPTVPGEMSYEKGISVRRKGELFEVCGISVDYVSSHLTGVGAAMGYHYELAGDRLVRHPSEADCTCGDPARHQLHLQALTVLDDMLSRAKVTQSGKVINVAC